MTRKEFKVLVKGMKAVYTQSTFLPDADAFNVWFELMEDLPYQAVSVAIQKYMTTEKFPPTIAELRKLAVSIANGKPLEKNEAWKAVEKSAIVAKYNPGEAFDMLPRECQITFGNRENYEKEAEKGFDNYYNTFGKNYERALQWMEDNVCIPPKTLVAIEECKPAPSAYLIEEQDPEEVNKERSFEFPTDEEENKFKEDHQFVKGLEEIYGMYPNKEYVMFCYSNLFLTVIDKLMETCSGFDEAIAIIKDVIEEYADYKNLHGWECQELGDFLIEFDRHLKEFNDKVYFPYKEERKYIREDTTTEGGEAEEAKESFEN